MRDADFLPRRVEADAAAPVEPVSTGSQTPGTPRRCIVQFDDELQQAIIGGIYVRAQSVISRSRDSARASGSGISDACKTPRAGSYKVDFRVVENTENILENSIKSYSYMSKSGPLAMRTKVRSRRVVFPNLLFR